VHRLKLRASNIDEFQHGAIVVEDALRTASLPGLPPNGLLLIRRLNLGKLAANSTSISVAHRIASRLQTLNVSVVRQHSAEQPRAGVVWFADDVEPHAILANLLVRNIQPQSWYWPRAVKGWSAHMTPHQGLRHVLYEVSRTPAGIAATSRVVEQVISAAGAGMLGRTLQPDDGHRLLALGGIQTPLAVTANGRGSNQMRRLDRSWRQTLSRLAPQWGQRDDRTTWLAHVAACAHSAIPSKYAVSGLLRELQQQQQAGVSIARRQQSPAPPLTPDTGGAEAINIAPHDDGENQRSPVRRERSEPERKAGPAERGERIKSRVPGTAGYAEAADTASAPEAGQSGRMMNAKPDHQLTKTSPDDLILPDATIDHHKNRPEPSNPEKGETAPFWEKPVTQQADHQPRQRPDPADASGEIKLAGVESKHAGLVYVLQALEWLGIRETLTAHPALEVHQLPARILWHCIDQLGISHDDPICQFLPALESVPAGESFDFVAPAAWQDLGRPAMSHAKILRRQAAAAPVNDLDLIISAYVAAMGSFLHNYARSDLRRMVTCTGYVATTRTHLDVTFDPAQLDIGIRRAGLDIDPGWVPWLGRVVYIHYQGREEIIDG
jgi:hypothetical protein